MAKDKSLSRREFIQYSAAGLAAASAGGTLGAPRLSAPLAMPTRTLGATGLEVSVLAFGGGSQFLANGEGAWETMLERAVEVGINYFDTSSSYQWDAGMSSEERFGEVLSPIRDRLYLSTKFDSRDPSEAMREFERSLERMKTDHVDVLFIHALLPSDDVSSLEKGVYAELRRLKEEGTVRFIGFSSMDSAERSREAIEALDFDVALLAMNATGYGDFITEALPAAKAKNMGVLAMKVMRDIVGESATAEELLAHALSLDGVATALIGHHGMATLEENVRIVQTLASGAGSPMSEHHRQHLESRLAHLAGPHTLCWARPGYVDGQLA
jgi:aryl-alcohol dehydrogenase-like predicted oxidoreductase